MKNGKEKNSKAQKHAKEAAKAFTLKSSFQNDPFGSYTGHPKDKGDKPVQDADDL